MPLLFRVYYHYWLGAVYFEPQQQPLVDILSIFGQWRYPNGGQISDRLPKATLVAPEYYPKPARYIISPSITSQKSIWPCDQALLTLLTLLRELDFRVDQRPR